MALVEKDYEPRTVEIRKKNRISELVCVWGCRGGGWGAGEGQQLATTQDKQWLQTFILQDQKGLA
jgi:hypothetical protein